ncbi:hypothetical protein EDD86DRAFT_195844 [Gorgonomyces haynaldii]|nr:hypothetical protein EDD86DRAFT_195844 [Gorgonomyces haynaldii]
MNQARFWMPCLDKPNEKFTVDIMVSVPMDQSLLGGSRHQMIAVCSGKLLSRLQQDKRFVYLFREDTPISTSSLVIAIGPWESIRLVQNKKLDNVDDQFTEKLGNQHSKIEIFYPLGYKKAVQATTFFLPQAMEFFEQWIGTSYPFDSFKIVFTEHLSGLSFIGSSCVVCGLDVLVQESTIDQVIETRSLLSQMLVRQWFGHYVSPTHWDDIWVIIGFVSVISQQFIRKLHGANEDKFRGRKDMERCVYLDVNQLPLCPSQMSSHLIENYPEHFPCYPEQDPQSPRSELLQLKAALVLQMMEKRMGKGLIQKICNRIIVQTMSGELLNGLSTLTFLKVARKISGKIEIKEFADQWIFGSGCPIFDVSYHFNRKKMVIELKIKQRSSNDGVEGCTHKFSGPFTIRVQEPAGQFDTEVKIEEYVQQYDIIYHTKYKRIRRQPKKKKKSDEQQEEEEEEEEEEVVAEQLQDGTVELKIAEPDRITFESIRLDPEGIWLCHKTFEQDDFMWLAILKKEKDVVAQLESVQGIARINTLASCHTLAALSKDPNLYYRLRIESIYSLMNFDTPELEYAGLTSLMKLLKDQFVMVSSVNLPKRNNFDNLIEYYILCALVDTITRFRSPEGHSQRMVRELLMDMLEYNDNTHNQFSDSYYVSLLIDSLSFSFMTRPRSYDDVWKIHETRQVPKERTRKLKKSDFEEIEFKTGSGFHQVDIPDEDIFKRCLKELERLLVQEYQVPSYRNTITVSCLTSYCFFQAHRMMKPNLELFLEYSRYTC